MKIDLLLAIFGFILTILSTVLVMYFKDMKEDLKSMSKSIFQLNVKLEKVISDQSWHKEEMTEIKERVTILEQKEN